MALITGNDRRPRELSLFTGTGGQLLASILLNWEVVCAVEIDAYCREVLLRRQEEKILEPFPIWDNVETFKGKPWRGKVDIITGGFPCQDVTHAWDGPGLRGERSGLWKEYVRIIKEVQPKIIYAENVANLKKRGLATVARDLAEMGYIARWGILSANTFGAPHERKRMFVFGYRKWEPVVFAHECFKCEMCEEPVCPYCNIHYSECACIGPHSEIDGWKIREKNWGLVAYPDRTRRKKQWWSRTIQKKHTPTQCFAWWSAEPGVVRVVNGAPYRVDRLRALGNGVVPAVARAAPSVLLTGKKK
jgi:DNA (cytosine-5)-methyltransferase 1